MKKLIALATAAAFLASAVPALAAGSHHQTPAPVLTNTVVVTNNNSAFVSNDVNTTSNTGYNGTAGGAATGSNSTGGSAVSYTGNASAGTLVGNLVNTNATDVVGCGCTGSNNVVSVGNTSHALVKNTVGTGSNTGDNGTAGGAATNTSTNRRQSSGPAVGGAAVSYTGNAGSRTAVVNIVNTNLTRTQ